MGNKKDVLPIVMASAIALVITGIVRWAIPGGTVIKQQPLKKELSLPDIPLMIKAEQKKIQEIQVLVTNTDIKKDEKIIRGKLNWKTWPANAVQPYFIAQDTKGNPMNNRADYNNALNMWAKNDIPAGIPLTISMLTNSDPVEVARKKKAEAEAAAAKEKKDKEKKAKEAVEEDIVKIGYRAVPFQVDQRTPISLNMIAPGDYVDVRINSNVGGDQKTYLYKSLKIIAIDGMTKKERMARQENSGGIFSSVGLGGMSTPKNVTLEIKENMVNTMLRQASGSGIIITVRSQNEKIEEDLDEGYTGDEKGGSGAYGGDAALLKDIWRMNNRYSSAEILRNSVQKKKEEENNLSVLLHNMNKVNRPSIRGADGQRKDVSNYEVVSGRIVSDPNENRTTEKEEPVKIYRKLTPEEIQFDKNGKKVTKGSEYGGSSERSGMR